MARDAIDQVWFRWQEVSLPRLDRSIEKFYELTPEESRLASGPSRLEELRTRELIARHVPAAPATVLDVGGAAGVYAFWLAERGYDVRLVDASARLVEIARKRNERVPRPLAACTIGDARDLAEANESADVVLLLGPLYHLVDASDRRQALGEAFRVLRKGGTLITAAISRWASVLDGLSRELFTDEEFAGIVDGDLATGRHRNPTDKLDYFTTAYFHRPEELSGEVAGVGFDVVGLYGIEGPAWMLPDFAARWGDDKRRGVMLRVARLVESEPAMVGVSAHLMVVGRKP
jgi:SAM-dependent methyltransferase